MRILLFLFLSFFLIDGYSQSKFTLKGSLTSQSNELILIGDVLLYQENQIIDFTSVLDGSFAFESIEQDDYLLKVVCVGFEVYEEKIQLKKNLELVYVNLHFYL